MRNGTRRLSMMRILCVGCGAAAGVAALFTLARPTAAQAPPPALALQVKAILAKQCASCHGPQDSSKKGFDVARRDTLVILKKVVVPQHPEKSELVQRVLTDNMPYGDQKVSAADKKVLEEWVKAGAPDWEKPAPAVARHRVSEKDQLRTIIRDLETADEADRTYLRYFSLANLHNNPEVPASKLKLFQSALSKLVNHLSWQRRVTAPKTIGSSGVLLRVDVRDYDWSPHVWDQAMALYPYGYVPRDLRGEVRQVHALSGAGLPYLRVDWFVANASLPPLYHDFLQLPETVAELERKLGVDSARNVAQLRAVRGGRRESGVSRHNRVVERHESSYGAYYKSFDFAGNTEDQNIFTNPLHFREDGGEFVFHLPNGLQGYMIADAAGRRLNEAPVNIVFDKTNKLDPVVRNGLSCIGCHSKGVNVFTDQVRDALPVGRRARFDIDHARRLYPEQQVLDRLFAEDNARFAAALAQTGSAMPESPEEEPITLLALDFLGLQFSTSVPVSQAAADLCLTTEALQRGIDRSEALERLGLNQLLGPTGGVKRDTWESTFAHVVEELALGEALRPAARRDRLEHPVGGDHDVRKTVAIGDLTGPGADLLRGHLITWLGRSSDLRVVALGGEYSLTGTVRPQGGALLVELGDARRGVMAEARAPAGDLEAAAEQIANKLQFEITGGRLLPSGAAGGGGSVAAIAQTLGQRLAQAAGRQGPVGIALTLDRGPGATYRAGERLEILFRVDRDCHLVLYNIDSAGVITLLFPNDPNNPSDRVRGGVPLSFAAEVDPHGNFGVETVVAYASLRPINAPGLREFQAEPRSKTLTPLGQRPQEVAQSVRREAAGGGVSSAEVRLFTVR